jgi:hypothetical protein
MYSEGMKSAKVGRVSVDIKGKSYRIRLPTPKALGTNLALLGYPKKDGLLPLRQHN